MRHGERLCAYCGEPIKLIPFDDGSGRTFWTHVSGKIECETHATPKLSDIGVITQ